MSYDLPLLRETYNLGSQAFGSAAFANTIKVPTKFRFCRIVDIHVLVSVLFTNTTTPAHFTVGKANLDTTYADLAMGVAPANHDFGTRDVPGAIKVAFIDTVADGITEIFLNLVAATGGSPAGTGIPHLVLEWW